MAYQKFEYLNVIVREPYFLENFPHLSKSNAICLTFLLVFFTKNWKQTVKSKNVV